jgi:oligopeptide transport system substrate-binding protein
MSGRLALSLGAITAALVIGSSAHAAGTFRYSLDTDIDYADPALAYFAPTWEILYATCTMLVSYPDAPAPRGARLVPDGAAAMPTVSRDGKTYTFAVRGGRRFSNGVAIRASHYAWALNRVLSKRMESPGKEFFRDIAGAKDVIDGNARTASGIRVLRGNRLRIRLTRRAPDILARLAMPFACALPLSTPLNPDGIQAPVVGSGPYYIAEWEPRRTILLRRNRFYAGPRPHRLNAILYDIGLPPATIKLNIDSGRTDYGPIQPAAHAQLGAQHGIRRTSPGRYFVNPRATLRYFTFNHERELFGKAGGGPGAGLGNVGLKRAINYAIDRKALIGVRGPFSGGFADQALPATMPGSRNAALYPVQPDVRRAQALAKNNLRSGRAVFYRCSSAACTNSALILRENLREIGLELDIRVFPPAGDRTGTRGEPFDMSQESWTAPYLDPQSFMLLFDGRTLRARDNTNRSYFDSARYDRRIAQATTMSGQARYRAFGALDVDLMRNAAPIAAFMHDNARRYFSARVRNVFEHPVYGLDLPAIAVE